MSATATSGRVPREVVVVGAGLAGARTAQLLAGAGVPVTLLGAEGIAPYDRPPLSKELLTRPEPAWLSDELGLDLDGVAVHLDRRATGLDLTADGVLVRTDAGPLAADATVVATGSSPLRPWPDALTLHTAADAVRLRAALGPGRRLVVVGAGWIGAEVAGVAAAAGTEVTVVEAAAAPLAAPLGVEVGRLTVPWYETAGVRLLTGTKVRDVTAGRVSLEDGTVIEADAVLAAIGVRPATRWLAATLPPGPGGALEVDAALRVPGCAGRVLAVGDVAVRASARHGRVPGGHWDGALREPEVAVATLLGSHGPDGPADPAPYLWSDQLGHHLAAYGLPGANDEPVLRGDPAGPFSVVWFSPGSEVVTAVLAVDRPPDAAAARRLFAGPALPRLGRDSAADPDLPLR
ncbi:FAD-dependent oxidoreductase [Actinotalea sp. M2MS4P-6]|uniref:NAD(P)/FAD-dependent oxidoreductase n=1 Tax=Actinotalea sp. M2MS4P-6 TaxID=2983762 RepID=UPI0021E42024|nr:FAD-dependent oxidoreductase [Actinotalea sp. M2MS4P-6]MCV2395459.1 FAD-dependent oxidoreductase [Actinotalea sp. M2MS4P-6]